MIKKFAITNRDLQEIKNLNISSQDIQDDHYDYSKVVVKKPWGYEYLIFSNEEVAVWILYLKNEAQTSMHCHPTKKTSLVVLEGRVKCSNLTGDLDLSSGDGALFDKGVFHQTEAMSEGGAFVMEIETPVNKRDLVRLKDKYGRKGKGYETEDQHSFDIQNYNYISFDSLKIHHNLKKRFGECSITFKRLAGGKILDELKDLRSEDVICILKGRLHSSSIQSLIEVGDTMPVKDLIQCDRLSVVSNELEILVIKKIDNIIKVSDCVASFLSEKKITPVFVVPGEANVHLLDSIGRHEGLSFVCLQNEKSASLAVESFCVDRSDLGVLVVSSGASAANTIPGVANAWINSIPMLVISGQARTDQDSDGRVRQLGNKSLNIIELVESITKYAVKVSDPTMIRYHLDKAVYLASQGRSGPVWVDLPIDIQGMVVDEEDLKQFDYKEFESVEIMSDNKCRQQILEIIDLLKQASRPIILAGSGIRSAKAVKEFLEFIEKIRVPVLTSRRGADLLPDDHPCFFGRPGTYGQRSANLIIQNCDLLISIGSRLSIPLIGRNTQAFARAARKVVVDIDSNELKKLTVIADICLAMDAGKFIRECQSLLPDSLPSFPLWIESCKQWRLNFLPDSYTGPSLPPAPPVDGLIYPLPLLGILSDVLGEKDVVVADGGGALIYTLLAFRFKSGQRLISSTGLELPGFALAGAIGASIAGECKPVICICEDRGFQISIQDLQTILDYQLPIKVLILKSKGHAIIRNIQRDYFGGRFVGTSFEFRQGSAPLIQISKVFGFQTFEVFDAGHITSTLQDWLREAGPAVCEIHIEDDMQKIPRTNFIIREDQEWIANPLEDMSPLLDRETLVDNMIIDLFK